MCFNSKINVFLTFFTNFFHKWFILSLQRKLGKKLNFKLRDLKKKYTCLIQNAFSINHENLILSLFH